MQRSDEARAGASRLADGRETARREPARPGSRVRNVCGQGGESARRAADGKAVPAGSARKTENARACGISVSPKPGAPAASAREKAEILDEKAINRAMMRISYEILERNHGADKLCLIGILRRGAALAARIRDRIADIEGRRVDTAFLDITPFRDDCVSPAPSASPSAAAGPFGFPVAGRRVVLVDDVIFTGRSARAAIEAVIRQGRPERIELAVLIDRGHRELPIRADFVGKNVPTARSERVDVMLDEYDGVNRVAIFEKVPG